MSLPLPWWRPCIADKGRYESGRRKMGRGASGGIQGIFLLWDHLCSLAFCVSRSVDVSQTIDHMLCIIVIITWKEHYRAITWHANLVSLEGIYPIVYSLPTAMMENLRRYGVQSMLM